MINEYFPTVATIILTSATLNLVLGQTQLDLLRDYHFERGFLLRVKLEQYAKSAAEKPASSRRSLAAIFSGT
jgi:hypothetical protein